MMMEGNSLIREEVQKKLWCNRGFESTKVLERREIA